MNRGNKASTVIATVFVEGQELTDKKQIPEAFNNHIVNIGNKLAGTIEQTDTCSIDNIDETNKSFSFNPGFPGTVKTLKWQSCRNSQHPQQVPETFQRYNFKFTGRHF